jgi:lipoyl(octanoyl) transferase
MNDTCVVRRLGLVEYADGLSLQSQFAAARHADAVPDSLLLLEHPPVLTVGRTVKRHSGGLEKHLLVSPRELVERGIVIFDVNRGGAVTYHGPGQLVAYPILKLKGKHRDVHRYLRSLEEVVIRTLQDLEIKSDRVPGLTGVWVNGDKIASIGVHLSRWITTHGLALNVSTDLSFFGLIHPCGLTNIRMTSVEALLGRPVPLQKVEDRFIAHFSSVFDTAVVEHPVDRDSVQIIIHRQEHNAILLLRRTDSDGGFWQPVTGLVEPGESAIEAAHRELIEETGLEPGYDGLSDTALIDLEYTHSFTLGGPLHRLDPTRPTLVREHSFALFIEGRILTVKLDPSEHDDYRFVDTDTALALVPWEGNKHAIRLTDRIAHAGL